MLKFVEILHCGVRQEKYDNEKPPAPRGGGNTNLYTFFIMDRKQTHFDEIRNYLKVAHAARVDQLSIYLSHFNKGMNGADVYEIVTSVYGDWEKDWKDKPLDEMVELLRIYDSRIEPMSSQEYEIWAENRISFLRSWIFNDISYIKYIACWY